MVGVALQVSSGLDSIESFHKVVVASMSGKSASKPGVKDVAVNRQASHNYLLLERFEAGLALTGTEVKALRQGKANLRDAYGTVKAGEAWLINCHISTYQPGSFMNHPPLRPRKLLLHKHELRKLTGKVAEKGLTLIPLRIYFKNGLAKCELALARGKKLHDKREAARRRIADEEARAEIARRRKQ